jgi:hypothetical protein
VKKKVLIVFSMILTFFLFPLSNAFANTDYYEVVKRNVLIEINHQIKNGDILTLEVENIKLRPNSNIHSYTIYGEEQNFLNISLAPKNVDVIEQVEYEWNKGTHERFYISSFHDMSVNEMRLYKVFINGEQVFPDSIIEFNDVEGFSVSNNGLSNTLQFDISNVSEGFTGVDIYRDGELIVSLDNKTTSYVDTVTEYNTPYLYKIVAKYGEFESAGVTFTIITGSKPLDPSEIPPSNVTALIAKNIKSDRVLLEWRNSNDTDLASVNVYLDGILHTNIPLSSSYELTGLNPLTDYTIGIQLVDHDGNLSPISTVNITTLDGDDLTPPPVPKNVEVEEGNKSLFVKWQHVNANDLDGYYVYVDGEKINSTPIKNNSYVVSDLLNGEEYNIQVSSVDYHGNESDLSSMSFGIPTETSLPFFKFTYTLADVAKGVSSWFAQSWPILAFAVAIPMSFYIASRVKLLFLD